MARFRNTAWVQLISIDVAESLERTRQNNKMEGNYKNNQNIGENEIDECTNALDTELDEEDEIQPDNGKGHQRQKCERCSPNSLRPISYFGSIWESYVLDLKTNVFCRKKIQLHFPMNKGLTVPK